MDEGQEFNLQNIRAELAQERSNILNKFAKGEMQALTYTRAHSDLVDAYVKRLLDHYLGNFRDEVAVFMQGGNGWRQEVYPHSDTDLTVVCPDEWSRREAFNAAMEQLTQALWDIGIKGNAVPRSINESVHEARTDQTVRTTLEDRRLLWGDDHLAYYFDTAMNTLSRKAWLESKLEEGKIRRAHEEAGRPLSPDVKQGGLRELHEIFWVAKAAGFGKGTLDDLIEAGVISANEKSQLEDARAFLATVRCHLHRIMGRENDKLGPEEQVELARSFSAYRRDDDREAVELFMRDYIRHARMISFWRAIVDAAAIVKWKAQEEGYSARALNDFPQFVFRDRRQIDFADDRDPELIDMIRIFDVAQEREYEIHPFALRTMRRHSEEFNENLFNRDDAKALLKNILTRDKLTGEMFSKMQAVGLLLRLVPPYTNIDAVVDHRPEESFSVDHHHFQTLTAVNALERGAFMVDAQVTMNVCRSITGDNEAGQANRRILHFALLMYKTGKSQVSGADRPNYPDHSAQNARAWGHRFGLSSEEIDEAVWLVEKQRLMSSTAYCEDLSDPVTIRGFADVVGNEDRLKRLLVFTVSGIIGNGIESWKALQNSYIELLYKQAETLLKGPAQPVSSPAITLRNEFNRQATRIDIVALVGISSFFLRIAKQLGLENLNITDASLETDEFGAQKGRVVVQTVARQACDQDNFFDIQTALIDALTSDDVLDVELPERSRRRANGGYSREAGVSTNCQEGAKRTRVKVDLGGRDEPYLLARLLDVFNQHGLNVLGMKAIVSGVGMFVQASDVFFVQDRGGNPLVDEGKIKALENDLWRVLPEADQKLEPAA